MEHSIAQEVITCDICLKATPQKFCNNCQVNLCKACVNKHLDGKKCRTHEIVLFQDRNELMFPQCSLHPNQICEAHCQFCEIPVCMKCVIKSHSHHKLMEIAQLVCLKRDEIRSDMEELRKVVIPRCKQENEEIVSKISKAQVKYEQIHREAEIQRRIWHQEVDGFFNKVKSKIHSDREKYIATLKWQQTKLKQLHQEMCRTVQLNKDILMSKQASTVTEYQSKLKDYIKRTSITDILFTSIQTSIKKGKELFLEIGQIKASLTQSDEQVNDHTEATACIPNQEDFKKCQINPHIPIAVKADSTLSSQDLPDSINGTCKSQADILSLKPVPQVLDKAHNVSSPPSRKNIFSLSLPNKMHLHRAIVISNSTKGTASSSLPGVELLNKSKVISKTPTRVNNLNAVACFGTHEAWICGESKNICRIDLHGFQKEAVTATCKYFPGDIAVTKNGELLYSDINNRTINIVRKGISETLLPIPKEWYPYTLCFTRSGDILVGMFTADNRHHKIVRYQGLEVKQEIEKDFNYENPLFKGGERPIYITENVNGDVCAADLNAKMLLVVDNKGKEKFRYNGTHARRSKPFVPGQVVTDSSGHIIMTDQMNDCLHVLDQNGQFLKCIDDCHLEQPTGLSIDEEGRLWVGSYKTGEVKVIEYTKPNNGHSSWSRSLSAVHPSTVQTSV
ncbi:uncharacterized protein LOC133194746 [Saccostrea echinata]|uniref:uncharacterized protein LOC133194746 n=1 Tax=Saccostrea echinata TaxID=191078 RepID=UPI002A828379|nr:uncharacterized protein LOC133194746 [Saccostrea echinata]